MKSKLNYNYNPIVTILAKSTLSRGNSKSYLIDHTNIFAYYYSTIRTSPCTKISKLPILRENYI